MTDIASLIRRDTPRIAPDMPMRRATALLVEAGASAAPVVDDSGRLVGMLSQKDCFGPALHASYYREWKGNVAEVMSREVETLPLAADLVTAAEAFRSRPYRAFPVLDGERLAGMLHRSDVLRALIALG